MKGLGFSGRQFEAKKKGRASGRRTGTGGSAFARQQEANAMAPPPLLVNPAMRRRGGGGGDPDRWGSADEWAWKNCQILIEEI